VELALITEELTSTSFALLSSYFIAARFHRFDLADSSISVPFLALWDDDNPEWAATFFLT
jgi:hypothetical protein